jgi:HEPN domain-containing protein
MTGEERLPTFDLVLSARAEGGYDASVAFCNDVQLRLPITETLQAEVAEAAKELAEGLSKLGPDGEQALEEALGVLHFAAGFEAGVLMRADDAWRQHRRKQYPEAILAAQEALELNAEVIFLATIGEYPKDNMIDDRKFRGELRKVLDHIPPTIDPGAVVKALFVARFWAPFHTMARYEMEGLQMAPPQLFGEREAHLALDHLSEVFTCGLDFLEQKLAALLPERELALTRRLFELGLRAVQGPAEVGQESATHDG